MVFQQAEDTNPNCVLMVTRNMFLVEVGEDQSFKFMFLEGEVLTLIVIALRRNDILAPLCQIASSKIPLIEFLIKVKFYFKIFFSF